VYVLYIHDEIYFFSRRYARSPTGLSPEIAKFDTDEDFYIPNSAKHYLLRPEVVESLFVLNYLTGDPIYREWGWEIFLSIEKYCKAQYGYGSKSDVRNIRDGPDDSMESFFLAETLKYLYLLFDPDTEVDILNTVSLSNDGIHSLLLWRDPSSIFHGGRLFVENRVLYHQYGSMLKAFLFMGSDLFYFSVSFADPFSVYLSFFLPLSCFSARIQHGSASDPKLHRIREIKFEQCERCIDGQIS